MQIKSLSDENIKVKFSIFKTLQLWVPIAATVFGVLYYPPKPIYLFFNFAFIYFFVCLGHSVGLHRYFIHETFKAKKFMEPVFLILTSLSGIGGPLTWIKIHALRDHWQNEPQAPIVLGYRHNVFLDFFYNLHLNVIPKNNQHLKRLPVSILNDSRIIFFEKYWLHFNLVLCLFIYVIFGIGAVIWIMAFRYSMSIMGHWLVGYTVHRWGEKRYEIKNASEEGRNQLFLGWLTFGEAYHNNHHKFPSSASMGLKKVEFDLAYVSIIILEKINLVGNIKVSQDHYSYSQNESCEDCKILNL